MKPHALLIALAIAMNANAADTPTPPDATQKPHTVKAPHGAQRQD